MLCFKDRGESDQSQQPVALIFYVNCSRICQRKLKNQSADFELVKNLRQVEQSRSSPPPERIFPTSTHPRGEVPTFAFRACMAKEGKPRLRKHLPYISCERKLETKLSLYIYFLNKQIQACNILFKISLKLIVASRT